MCFIFQNNISPILTLEVTKILIPYLSFDLLLHFSYGNKLLENLKSLIRNDEDEEKVGLSLEVIDQIL